jgi:hypothetical protein
MLSPRCLLVTVITKYASAADRRPNIDFILVDDLVLNDCFPIIAMVLAAPLSGFSTSIS